jgi:hypothetical protein
MPDPSTDRGVPVMPPPAQLTRASLIPYPLIFLTYSLFAIYFYFAVIAPYLATSDLYAPRILADAITYEAICVAESNFFDQTTLRDIGPCIGLRLFSYNSGLLSVFNAFVIFSATLWLARVYQRPWRPILTLLLINPITFLSIFGPNKEVFGLTALTTLAIFIRSRSLPALGICLVTALFTRLPAFVIIAAFCMLLVSALPRQGILTGAAVRRYWLIMIGAAMLISLIAAIFGAELQYNLLGDFSRTDDISQSTGISLAVDYLSGYGLYVLLYVFRMLLNLYSGMIGLVNLWQGDSANYYTVGVAGSSVMFTILSAMIAFGKRPDDMVRTATAWNMILFAVLFTLMICLSPVIQHRYFYPLYIFIILFVIKRDAALIAAGSASGIVTATPMPGTRP